MATPHYIQKARKPIYKHGLQLPNGTLNKNLPNKETDEILINSGESYYWWKLRDMPKQFSKTYPKESQLTNNPYLNRIWILIERSEGFKATDMLPMEINDLIDDLMQLKEELYERLTNMPKQFRNNTHGAVLQHRINKLFNDIAELSEIDTENTDYEAMLNQFKNCNFNK